MKQVPPFLRKCNLSIGPLIFNYSGSMFYVPSSCFLIVMPIFKINKIQIEQQSVGYIFEKKFWFETK